MFRQIFDLGRVLRIEYREKSYLTYTWATLPLSVLLWEWGCLVPASGAYCEKLLRQFSLICSVTHKRRLAIGFHIYVKHLHLYHPIK